jgi:hypothetical protein
MGRGGGEKGETTRLPMVEDDPGMLRRVLMLLWLRRDALMLLGRRSLELAGRRKKKKARRKLNQNEMEEKGKRGLGCKSARSVREEMKIGRMGG